MVRDRRSHRNVVFAFLAVVTLGAPILAVVRGEPHDTDDVVVMSVLVLVGLLVLVRWWSLSHHPHRLIISPDAIELERVGAVDGTPLLSRSHGDTLVFMLGGMARSRHWVLTNVAGSTHLSLQFFNRHEVEQACIDAGWFVGDDKPAEY